MKRILAFAIYGMLFVAAPSFAATKIYESEAIGVFKSQQEKQRYINSIGFRILNANKIKQRMNFIYSNKNIANAFSNNRTRSITIYHGIIAYTEDEDEIAAILSHEISHSIDSYNGIFRGTFEIIPHLFVPRKYERKADKRGVDFMVNAGYNPVAMIIMMNKVMSQGRYEFLSTHPLTSRRMAYVYEYIYTKYPQYLKNNKYQDNIYYQNFLLTSQDNRRKLQKKIESKSDKKVRYD